VLTWPVVTVFGLIAVPNALFFLKPIVMRKAAGEYDLDFRYRSTPNWETYSSVLEFAETVRLGPARPSPERQDRHPVLSVGAGSCDSCSVDGSKTVSLGACYSSSRIRPLFSAIPSWPTNRH
jgi:hypothetical protein